MSFSFLSSRYLYTAQSDRQSPGCRQLLAALMGELSSVTDLRQTARDSALDPNSQQTEQKERTRGGGGRKRDESQSGGPGGSPHTAAHS